MFLSGTNLAARLTRTNLVRRLGYSISTLDPEPSLRQRYATGQK